MRRRSFLSSMVLGSLALMTLAGCGGSDTGAESGATITGTVVSGDPATVTTTRANATVRAYRVPAGSTDINQGSFIAQAQTDILGAYSITVPAGRYVLQADLPDGVDSTQFRPSQFVRDVTSGQTVTGATLGHVAVAP